MLIGMGIVYLFLALLVSVISMTSKLIHRYTLEPQPHIPFHAPVPQGVESDTGDDVELVAAISAAIHQHQNTYP